MRSVTIGSENSSLVNVTRYRPEYSAFFETPLLVTAELIKMVQYIGYTRLSLPLSVRCARESWVRLPARKNI
jgi:hypothetical protein